MHYIFATLYGIFMNFYDMGPTKGFHTKVVKGLEVVISFGSKNMTYFKEIRHLKILKKKVLVATILGQ